MNGKLAMRVLESNLPPALKPTAVVMALYASEQGRSIRPSVPLVAWLLGVTERAVQASLERLRTLGVLIPSRPIRRGRRARNAERLEYQLELPLSIQRPSWRIAGFRTARITKPTSQCREGIAKPASFQNEADFVLKANDTSQLGLLSFNDQESTDQEYEHTDGAGADAPASVVLNESDEAELITERFERLWLVYPRGVAKDQARAAFLRLKPDDALTGAMMAAVERQKRTEWGGKDPRYIPHLRTWLEAARWTDAADDIAPVSQAELDQARRVMGSRFFGRCPHSPPCASTHACLIAFALQERERGQSRRMR